MLCFWSFLTWGYGQDIHFSQNFNLPSQLNPAFLVGTSPFAKLTAATRTQWNSVTIPYITHFFAAESKLGRTENILNAGISFASDVAGDGIYRINKAGLRLAKMLKLKSSSLLFFGIGINQSSVSYDLSKFKFNNQYANGYQAQLPHGENPATDLSLVQFDAGIGMFIQQDKESITLGFSVQNLNTVNYTFYDRNNELGRLYQGQLAISSRGTEITKEVYVLYGRQQKQDRILIQGILKPTTGALIPILGLGFRIKDATIISVGLSGSKWQGMYSFDINTSRLKQSSHRNGAHELTLIYIFGLGQKSNQNQYCPSFI